MRLVREIGLRALAASLLLGAAVMVGSAQAGTATGCRASCHLVVGVGTNFPTGADTLTGFAAAEASNIADGPPGTSGGFGWVRVESRRTAYCGSQYPAISTFSGRLKVDVLISGITPCSSPPYGGVGSIAALRCTSDGTVTSTGYQCWADNAVAYFAAECGSVRACPELEVLNEPAASSYWGSGAGSASNADAYATLLATTYRAFQRAYGTASPRLLASYDGGASNSYAWGDEVWSNYPGDAHLDLARDVGGITFHPYAGCCTRPDFRANIVNAESAARSVGVVLPPVYVTEVGWDTSLWSEAAQSSNYASFVDWAWCQPDIAQVLAFTYVDYGTTSNLWGLVGWDAARQSVAPKPAWDALVAAARRQPSC